MEFHWVGHLAVQVRVGRCVRDLLHTVATSTVKTGDTAGRAEGKDMGVLGAVLRVWKRTL